MRATLKANHRITKSNVYVRCAECNEGLRFGVCSKCHPIIYKRKSEEYELRQNQNI